MKGKGAGLGSLSKYELTGTDFYEKAHFVKADVAALS
jgi:hypothetical protein